MSVGPQFPIRSGTDAVDSLPLLLLLLRGQLLTAVLCILSMARSAAHRLAICMRLLVVLVLSCMRRVGGGYLCVNVGTNKTRPASLAYNCPNLVL